MADDDDSMTEAADEVQVPGLTIPTTASEQAYLLTHIQRHMGPSSVLVLRRILFELDRVKADPRLKLPIVRRP